MPTRDKKYTDVKYPAEVFSEVYLRFAKYLRVTDDDKVFGRMSCGRDNDKIEWDDEEEYLRQNPFLQEVFNFNRNYREQHIAISKYHSGSIDISVKLEDLRAIEDVLGPLDQNYRKYKMDFEQILRNKIIIFIGHGRNPRWRDLKDHLHEHHGFTVETYESGARAGYTIQEVLAEVGRATSIAFLVHTAEDENLDGTFHARENVIHETGLFQGIVGFKRAIILLEEGCNEFSNIVGINQIRFTKGNIREVFGDVLAVIRREFRVAFS